MGTDITLYAEIRKDGKWEPIPEPAITQCSKGKIVPIEPIEFGRPYELFMALAGVCQGNLRQTLHAVVKPISEPRGLPEDMNAFYRKYFQEQEYQFCFGHSWLMLKEIIDYDWDGQFVRQKAYVKNQYASLFKDGGSFPDGLPEGEKLYFILPNWRQQPDTTEVSWVMSYRQYVGCSEWFIEELLKLGSPAPLLGFSGYQPLVRAYIGQGLRADLERLEGDTVSALIARLKRHGVSDEAINEALSEVREQ